MKRTFSVKAIWDDEAQVFYAQSDIEGLYIEAASLDEFEEIMLDAAPELIMANHRSASEIAEHHSQGSDTGHFVGEIGDRGSESRTWQMNSTEQSPERLPNSVLSIGKTQKVHTRSGSA